MGRTLSAQFGERCVLSHVRRPAISSSWHLRARKLDHALLHLIARVSLATEPTRIFTSIHLRRRRAIRSHLATSCSPRSTTFHETAQQDALRLASVVLCQTRSPAGRPDSGWTVAIERLDGNRRHR